LYYKGKANFIVFGSFEGIFLQIDSKKIKEVIENAVDKCQQSVEIDYQEIVLSMGSS